MSSNSLLLPPLLLCVRLRAHLCVSTVPASVCARFGPETGHYAADTTFTYAHADDTAPAPSVVSLAGLPTLLRGQRHGFIAASDVAAAGPAGMYAVNVTNTGKLDADDVVLGFLTPPSAGQGGVPLKSLFAFERVHVPAGKTVTVQLYPELTDFALVDSTGTKTLAAGDWTLEFGVAEGGGYARRTLRAQV